MIAGGGWRAVVSRRSRFGGGGTPHHHRRLREAPPRWCGASEGVNEEQGGAKRWRAPRLEHEELRESEEREREASLEKRERERAVSGRDLTCDPLWQTAAWCWAQQAQRQMLLLSRTETERQSPLCDEKNSPRRSPKRRAETESIISADK